MHGANQVTRRQANLVAAQPLPRRTSNVPRPPAAAARETRRRTAEVGVSAWAVYTSGHPLEFHRKSVTSCHCRARLAGLPDGKSRFASLVMRSTSGLARGFHVDQDWSWHRTPESAISMDADYSLSLSVDRGP